MINDAVFDCNKIYNGAAMAIKMCTVYWQLYFGKFNNIPYFSKSIRLQDKIACEEVCEFHFQTRHLE